MERRDFIKMLGLAGTSAAAYAACSAYMQRGAWRQSTVVDDLLSSRRAHCENAARLTDIEHVVILMQENRSLRPLFRDLARRARLWGSEADAEAGPKKRL